MTRGPSTGRREPRGAAGVRRGGAGRALALVLILLLPVPLGATGVEESAALHDEVAAAEAGGTANAVTAAAASVLAVRAPDGSLEVAEPHARADAADGTASEHASAARASVAGASAESTRARADVRAGESARASVAAARVALQDGLVVIEHARVHAAADATGVRDGAVTLTGVTVAGTPVATPVPANLVVPVPGGFVVLAEVASTPDGVIASAARLVLDDGTELTAATARVTLADASGDPLPKPPRVDAFARGHSIAGVDAGAAARAVSEGTGNATGGAPGARADATAAFDAAHGEARVDVARVTLLDGLIVAEGLSAWADARVDDASAAPAAGARVHALVLPVIGLVSPVPENYRVVVPGVGVVHANEADVTRVEDADASTTRAVAEAVALRVVLPGGETRIAEARVDAFAPRRPALDVTLDVDAPIVHEGEVVGFHYEATSTGTATLVDGTITDDRLGVICSYRLLRPGASVPCARLTPVYAPAVHTGVAAGVDHWGREATATATGAVDVAKPAIDLVLNALPARIHVGDAVTYVFEVTNAGNVPLTAITVTDDEFGAVCSVDSLAPGEGGSCTVGPVARHGSVLNVATADGTDAWGVTVTDADDALVTVLRPAIDLTLLADPVLVHAGDPVVLTFVVHNPTPWPLFDVTVTDSVLGTVCTIPRLDAEDVTCEVTEHPLADLAHEAVATGTDEIGGVVMDAASASIDVVDARIDIRLVPDPLIAHAGDDVTFTYAVSNLGDATLSDVHVTDDAVGAVCAPGSLPAGASVTCTRTTPLTASTRLTARATGADPLNAMVAAEDSARVRVIRPAIMVTASATPNVVYGASEVTFTYEVTNLGDTPLDVEVEDDRVGAVCTVPDLAAGASHACSVTDAVSATTIVQVNATGTDEIGGVVEDHDFTGVRVIRPALRVVKTPSASTVPAGTLVTYTFNVTNVGVGDVSQIRLEDDHVGHVCDVTILQPGAWATCTANATLNETTTNVVVATGVDAGGGVVDATASATVVVRELESRLDLTKRARVKTLESITGDESWAVTYTFTVTNSGSAPLYDVVVEDDHLGTVCTIDVLQPGESVTCSARGIIRETTTNVATASGRDEAGNRLTAQDKWTVTVTHPALRASISVSSNPARPGEFVRVTHGATNAGDVTLTDVKMVDENGAPVCTVAKLEPGVTATCHRTVSYRASGEYPLRNDVAAVTPLGNVVTASATITLVIG